jgi:outer membrane protein insertion porin family
MSRRKPFLIKRLLYIVAAVYFFTGCAVVPRHYPVNRPFVFKYNINVEGNFTDEEREKIESGLKNQLDDSIRVRSTLKLWRSGFLNYQLEKPPVYDSANADKSARYMSIMLKRMGYFKDTIRYDTTLKIVHGDQYRTTVNFNVKPGKVVRLDSISYNIAQPELQQLAVSTLGETWLHKDGAFATDTISYELDRLVSLYRDNGFMRFSRDELIGLWDTLDVSLLDPSLDPFTQATLLDSLRKRRENPKANLEIRLKPGVDTNRLKKYYIGEITAYPDYNPDSSSVAVLIVPEITMVNGIKVIHSSGLFKPRIIPQNIYLYRDSLYRQSDYTKTLNRFNALGAWSLVSIEPKFRNGQDTVDFAIKLTPARKFSFTANLEGSRNQSAISGNLLGFGLDVGVQNRNLWRAANQSTTNIRYGIETGRDTLTDVKFTQSRQVSFRHNIYFPRPIPNSKWIPRKFRDNFQTVLSFSAATTERRNLYNLITVNGSWGYDFQWPSRNGKINKTASVKIPNIEYSYLNPKPQLDILFNNNPALRNIFTDGFISSIILGYTETAGNLKNVRVRRFNLEESGIATGMLHGEFLDTNLYRFIKLDAEYIWKISYFKSALVLRFFTGVGYELNSTVNPKKRNSLPFFKQYFSGGPNSMRAWKLRQLGPGSVIKSFGPDGFPERYGDVQLEGNIEYRYLYFKVSGVKVNGALFTDFGNIWYLKKQAGKPEEVFNFGRLGKDLAVGVGTGLRVDFNFLAIRLDYSWKAKNPSPSPDFPNSQNKWFYNFKPFGGQLQLGISYPFIL